MGLALMIFRGLRRDMFPLATLLTMVPIGALILSGSRAGIIGFVFEVAVLGLLARSHKTVGWQAFARNRPRRIGCPALVAWLGAGKAIERFSLSGRARFRFHAAFRCFAAVYSLFLAYPVSGSGLGTLVAVYPKFETFYDEHIVDHIHNDYVELLAEMGMIGGICGLAFLWILVRDARVLSKPIRVIFPGRSMPVP